MYLLFRYHDILPSSYQEMGFGERIVVKAFMHYEIEQRNAEIEKAKEGTG